MQERNLGRLKEVIEKGRNKRSNKKANIFGKICRRWHRKPGNTILSKGIHVISVLICNEFAEISKTFIHF